MSGRALARAPLGGGFPALPFSVAGWGHSSAVGHVSSRPSLKFPYVGFSPVRLQASGTSQFGTKPSAGSSRSRPIPPYPRSDTTFAPPFDDASRRVDTSPLRAKPPATTSPPEPRGPRSSRVFVVPAINACRPHPPVWTSPPHFPERPVIDAVFDISRIILSDLQTFRTFAAVLSSIAAFNTPGAPVRAPQFFRTGTGHRAGTKPLATPSIPQISSTREVPFDA